MYLGQTTFPMQNKIQYNIIMLFQGRCFFSIQMHKLTFSVSVRSFLCFRFLQSGCEERCCQQQVLMPQTLSILLPSYFYV